MAGTGSSTPLGTQLRPSNRRPKKTAGCQWLLRGTAIRDLYPSAHLPMGASCSLFNSSSGRQKGLEQGKAHASWPGLVWDSQHGPAGQEFTPSRASLSSSRPSSAADSEIPDLAPSSHPVKSLLKPLLSVRCARNKSEPPSPSQWCQALFLTPTHPRVQ